jgi:hypothetical protein
MIGLEARRFKWTRKMKGCKFSMLPETTTAIGRQNLGFGTHFYVLGPVPDEV